ncbi:MAG: ABC transporter permease [Saprospiraceae bacterium]
MRTLLFLVQKEFLQIFRNKTMLPMMLFMPIFQMLLLAFAANYEVKNLNLSVIDRDLSGASRQLTGKFAHNHHFRLREAVFSEKLALEGVAEDSTDLVLEIPHGFERDLVREGNAAISLTANAINAQKAGIASGYATQIIREFNREFAEKWVPRLASLDGGQILASSNPQILIEYSNWYNPRLDYKTFMVPGILGELVALIICMLTALNIVREREVGTIEQINVSPVRKWQFIAGKFIPFWLISLFIMTVGLTVGKLVFDIPMLGSLWLVFGYTAAFMPAMLGLGFLISNFAETQQQALFTAWFFLIIFILMCGLFTPVESMPDWAQTVNRLNPVAYFVQFMRLVLLKGSGFEDIKHNLFTVLGYAAVVNTLAVWTYRKRA